MPKGKVMLHQRAIGRIFRAAKAAKYPVEQIEFNTADGTIIVKPCNREDVPAVTRDDEQRWDKAIHDTHEKRTA